MEATEEVVPAWYAKFFGCLKNRNRINPSRVELPHSDFLVVGPRRTLRILKPSLKAGWYYESTNDRPESINDNFFTRWSRRPHPSGNCRCSFRQSTRLSSTEEQIISAEINKIRTSLCEAEKAGRDIEELEQKISANLENLIPITREPGSERDPEGLAKASEVQGIDEKLIKNKIVKDLEKYINDLLEEILTDTVKFIADSEKFIAKDHDCIDSVCMDLDHLNACKSLVEMRSEGPPKPEADVPEGSEENEGMFNKISFEFHSDSDSVIQKEDSNAAHRSLGYANPAFLGSPNDPDAVEFYLNRPVCKLAANCTLDHLDCVDSGINSVETIEFQPEQEQSLEESLMEIIDAKLGRTNLRKSWVDLSSEINDVDNAPEKTKGQVCRQDEEKLDQHDEEKPAVVAMEEVEKQRCDAPRRANFHDDKSESSKELNCDNNNFTDTRCAGDKAELQEMTGDPSFEKLRLEFNDESHQENVQLRRNIGAPISRKKLPAVSDEALVEDHKDWNDRAEEQRGRRSSKLPQVELQDYRKRWSELEESCSSYCEQNPRDFVMFRKNRKPMIVFLHGFGSCAEVFTSQLEYFSSLGYPCIAPDMLGHGMSSAPDRPRDYHFDKLFKDLDLVLQHYAFQPGQKCVLVAHNYGCSFAAALACKYDSNIHQLVLISGGGPTPLARPSAEGAGHCCLRATLAPLLMCGLRREIMYSVRGRQHPYCGSEPMEQWPSQMKYVLEGMVWQEGDHMFHRRICTPALLIHGLRDKKVSLVQECQMERTMVKAFLEALPSAGHSPMTDCPEQLNHMIHCFIDLWKNKKW